MTAYRIVFALGRGVYWMIAVAAFVVSVDGDDRAALACRAPRHAPDQPPVSIVLPVKLLEDQGSTARKSPR